MTVALLCPSRAIPSCNFSMNLSLFTPHSILISASHPAGLASSSSASPSLSTSFKTLDELVGNTPLVRLQRLPSKLKAGNTNTILVKLEGLNPSGSIMARPAFHLVKEAETKGLKKGDTLIAATSGNMGVALAAAGAVRGYRVTLVLPSPVAYGLPLPSSLTHLARSSSISLPPMVQWWLKRLQREASRERGIRRGPWSQRARGSCWTSSPPPPIRRRTTSPRALRSGTRPRAE